MIFIKVWYKLDLQNIYLYKKSLIIWLVEKVKSAHKPDGLSYWSFSWYELYEGVLLLPPEQDSSVLQVYFLSILPVDSLLRRVEEYICTHLKIWAVRGTVWVGIITQEHIIVDPAGAWAWIFLSLA